MVDHSTLTHSLAYNSIESGKLLKFNLESSVTHNAHDYVVRGAFLHVFFTVHPEGTVVTCAKSPEVIKAPEGCKVKQRCFFCRNNLGSSTSTTVVLFVSRARAKPHGRCHRHLHRSDGEARTGGKDVHELR